MNASKQSLNVGALKGPTFSVGSLSQSGAEVESKRSFADTDKSNKNQTDVIDNIFGDANDDEVIRESRVSKKF